MKRLSLRVPEVDLVETGNMESADILESGAVDIEAGLREERAARITEVVCRRLGIEPADLGDTDLFTDHGADSLGLIGVLAALEREFQVVIPQEGLDRMVSLAAVREVLAESVGW